MPNSLQPHGLQHARLPCPSPTPGACSNSCPLSRWCHPTISTSVIPFSSHLQSFPASGSSPRSQFFASGGQSIGASASASVLPTNIQDWFPLGLTGLISLGVIIWHLPGLLVFWTGLFQGWVSDSSCPINIISEIFTKIPRNYWGHLLVNYKIGAVRSQHVSRVYKRMKPAQKCSGGEGGSREWERISWWYCQISGLSSYTSQ